MRSALGHGKLRRGLGALIAIVLVASIVVLDGAVSASAAPAASRTPTVSLLTPTSGPNTGGNRVVVVGTGFTRVRAVYFGTTRATSVSVLSPTRLSLIAPGHPAGSVAVRVLTAYGNSTYTLHARYQYRAESATQVQFVGPDTKLNQKSGFLLTVACATANACVAGGRIAPTPNRFVGTIAQLAGGRWTARIAPLPPDAAKSPDVLFSASSCASSSFCVIIGNYRDNLGAYPGLIETVVSGVPHVSETPNFYYSITCSRGNSCVAVGESIDRGPVIDTLTNGRWESAPVPLPPGANGLGALGSVTCTDAATCVAVGDYLTPAPGQAGQVGLIETLAGGTWTATSAPTPADALGGQSSQLASVSCLSPGVCVAVGDYIRADGHSAPLIETSSGDTWTASVPPTPPTTFNATDGSLTQVSCSPTICAALGAVATAAADANFIETFTNGTWQPTIGPHLGNAPVAKAAPDNKIVSGISCQVSSACVVIGGEDDPSRFSPAEIDTLTPRGWRAAQAPNAPEPPARQFIILYGVTCTRQVACIAVGDASGIHGAGIVETGHG